MIKIKETFHTNGKLRSRLSVELTRVNAWFIDEVLNGRATSWDHKEDLILDDYYVLNRPEGEQILYT